MRLRDVLTPGMCAAMVATTTFAPTVRAQEVAEDATDLLERVADAGDARYHARQLVAYFGDEQSAAVLDVRSSKTGRFVRAESGSAVTRMWSRSGLGLVDGRYKSKHTGDVTGVGVRPEGVLAKYYVDVEEPTKVLGVELVPLTLTRRKDMAVAERWWVHAKTGVVYTREFYDAAADLVGMTTMIEMRWGEPESEEPVASDLDAASPARAIDAPHAPARLAGGYDFWRAYGLEVDGRRAQQWVYSDGLHALSVFKVGGRLARPDGFVSSELDGHRLWKGPGPGTWAWEGDGDSYVVVSEEAAIDVGELIEPLPKGGPSVWARLGSVWSRLFRAPGALFD